ncbi:MAG TPA: cation-transporting P-type ATPase [Acidobacteriota bacterium]|nr:cation-transporting P-type ATPase [Acidobacteriota bacterium]
MMKSALPLQLTALSQAAAEKSDPWHAEEAAGVLKALESDLEKGLSEQEARQRKQRYGPNRLREHAVRSLWSILFAQFKSLIVGLLMAASAVAFIFGETLEGWAVAVVIILNTAIGFFTELRAVRSMEALFALGSVATRVRRDGHVLEISAQELVPGDVVLVEGGDVVTADLRLLEASKLQADESALTGESMPVGKQTEAVARESPLAERPSMLYKGTAVTRGSGAGVVVATGMETELGQISALVDEAQEEATPLEVRLDQLGRRLIWATLGVTALVALSGTLAGKDLLLMIETGLALAVAAIPEGLPIVATIALARGMRRMARRNALINRLSSVETLGATTVIFTDKTGTLTENKMTLTRLALACGEVEIGSEPHSFRLDGQPVDPAQHQILRAALETGLLCSNASLGAADGKDEGHSQSEHGRLNGDSDGAADEPADNAASSQVSGSSEANDADEGNSAGKAASQATGDPLEVALLVAGKKAGIDRENLLSQLPEVREEAFDPETKMMATFHRSEDGCRVSVKGAPEPVLEACTQILTEDGTGALDERQRSQWRQRNEAMAAQGLRVLALAGKQTGSAEETPYQELTFFGLAGLLDPPRKEVRQAIDECRRAGIEVVMVTGDQPVTARGIAQAVGLVEDEPENSEAVVSGGELKPLDDLDEGPRREALQSRLFARVSPKQKLDLIELHQKAGHIVAMTGDGVNDAPALKKADIGIAMGRRGTQVAQEASDMVLKDDAFSTIVAAVREGRAIFHNIRSFVLYLMSCNVGEVTVVAVASLVGTTLPILPLQILFLNLVTDVFPALALGVGSGDEHIMERPPRDPDEPIMGRRRWRRVALYGLVFTASVLGALILARRWLGMDAQEAVTVSFLTLAFAQLWHVFNMRTPESGLIRNEITRNRYVWGALALCSLLLLGAVYLPILSQVLAITPPGFAGWGLVLVMSLIPLLAGQTVMVFRSHKR